MIICIKQLKKAKTKSGKQYYSFIANVEDGSKKDGKIWDIAAELKENDIISAIQFNEESYNGKTQLIVKDYEVLSEKQSKEFSHLQTATAIKFDKQECYSYIKHMIGKMGRFSKLVFDIIKDNEAGFLESPGAKAVHHDFKGGLLCHTYYVLKTCEKLSELYSDNIDVELLFAAAVLHDIGKIKVYSFEKDGTISNTLLGISLEHLYIGAETVENYVCKNKYDLTPKDVLMLKHCILSHHGQKDWGSPVVPAIFTAQLLHFADNIDAKYGIWKGSMFNTDKDQVFTDRVISLGGAIVINEKI